MPWELKPAATYKFRTFGASPRTNRFVRREAFGAVEEMSDTELLDQRNEFHGIGHRLLEMIPILAEFPELEVARQPRHRQRFRLRLK